MEQKTGDENSVIMANVQVKIVAENLSKKRVNPATVYWCLVDESPRKVGF